MQTEFPPFVARSYGRASTDVQVLSTEQQHSFCRDVFDFKKRIHPEWANAIWGGFVADEATCRETKFRERHYGSLILAATKPGDRIMCSTNDRLFGGLIDTCETIDLAQKMGFKIVMGDQEINPNDESAMAYHKILATFAELEVKRLRRRTREALQYRIRIGKPTGARVVGWKTVHCRVPGIHEIQKFYVPDPKARRLANELVAIKEANNLTYTGCRHFCNKIGRKQLSGRKWNNPTFILWCRAAENGFPLPNGLHTPAPIPPDAIPIKVNTITDDD